MAAFMKELEHLEIELEEIKSATDNFDDNKVIGVGGFGKVYGGKLSRFNGRNMVAFKRLDERFGQGGSEFFKEIRMLSCYRHQNLISLLGFCNQGGEMILVYEHAARGSLDRVLNDGTLTWTERLNICIDAAKGLSFLHDPNGTHQRVIHCDIKSANILLDENLKAKVSDFGLSKISPANQKYTFLFTSPSGTPGYCDPLYMDTYQLTKESDVYSFGVVLFEVLCGRVCSEYRNGKLIRLYVPFWKKSYEEKKLDEIIFRDLTQQMDPSSLETFAHIAYQCLQKSREQRPAMSVVVEKLKIALQYQELRYFKPSEYEKIIMAADPPLIYKSKIELKAILEKGFLVNKGKTLFSINDKEEHCESLYIEGCLNPKEIRHGSLKHLSNYNSSRFPGGRCYSYENEFKARVRAKFLSPLIKYSVNLVFRYGGNIKKYIHIRYRLDGETKVFIVYDADKRKDGWFVAPLYQFTSDHKPVDLEIIFERVLETLQVAGIELQPLEEKARHYQVLGYQDIVTASSQVLFYKSLEELKMLLSIGVHLNDHKKWFSINGNGQHCEMISIFDCLVPDTEYTSRIESNYYSRFPMGLYKTDKQGFKIHVTTQFLSPLTGYTVSLILIKTYYDEEQIYVDLEYKLEGETKTSTVYLANRRHKDYYVAELYQFTSYGKVGDLEIVFSDHQNCIEVEGILFQPLVNVEHDRVLEDKKMDTQIISASDILKLPNDSVQWTMKKNRYLNLLKMFHVYKSQEWFSGVENGKKCLMLSPRGVIRNPSPSFKSLPESRFQESAVIKTHSSVFEIVNKIKSDVVSRETSYAVYLVYKLPQDQSVFEAPLEIVNCKGRNSAYPYIYLASPLDTPVIREMLDQIPHHPVDRPKLNATPQQRDDSWMEVKIWEFRIPANTNTISMHLWVKHPGNKDLSGLIIQCIELRPT